MAEAEPIIIHIEGEDEMRVHIVAWGSNKYPDLDYEADDPEELDLIRWSYPCLSVECLTPIPYAAIMASLDQQSVANG